MKTSFTSRQDLSADIASFSFAKPEGFNYTAGQYIELSLIGHQEDGHTARRWFTLSSSPDEPELTITTRIGSAHSPFKKALAKLPAGAKVDVTQPMGDFVLPKLLQTPLIFVAGGIGITPFRSIFSWLATTGEQRPIQLLWSVRSEDDIIFQNALERSGQHATIAVSEPSSAWGGQRGRFSAEQILGLTNPGENALLYLSGPEPFVEGLKKDLIKNGLAARQIVTDGFPGYSGL